MEMRFEHGLHLMLWPRRGAQSQRHRMQKQPIAGARADRRATQPGARHHGGQANKSGRHDHLAAAILAGLIRGGQSGLFLAAADALQLMRDAYAPNATRSERETLTVLSDPDLLVLDEVGLAIGRDATPHPANRM